MELTVLSFNYKNSSLPQREGLAVALEKIPEFLNGLLRNKKVHGAVFLSTCNRLELYAALKKGSATDILSDYWFSFLGRSGEGVPASLNRKNGEAFEHLVQVSAGLDSMVLGEPQVLGQVKEAYARALELKASGALLNFAFQQAFRIAKQVRTQTGIARFPVSVSTVSLMMMEQVFGDFKEVTAMVAGLGEMGRQTAALLKDRGVQKLIIMNRTFSRAQEFAAALKAEACPLDALATVLPMADMVVACTAAPGPIVTGRMVGEAMLQRKERPMVLMDLGFPRDIEPDVANFENAYLYNVDDLKGIADKNLSQRQKEAKLAEEIIEKEIAFFAPEWVKRAEFGRVAQLVRVLP